MIQAIIIDDEQNNIDNLAILLNKNCPKVEIIATALTSEEGESIILKHNPDLVFLDIQMPDRNGFDLIKSLQNISFEIIFVTAFNQYGIQALKLSAIDYLLKPINITELKFAVQKAEQKIVLKKQNLSIENLINLLQQKNNKEFHKIALQSSKETRFIEAEKIIRCESSNNYTTFFLVNGQKIMTSKPIYKYEEMLSDYGFIRCHQSHLVNKKFIKSWVKELGGYLLLDDLSQIPISLQKREYIKSLFM